MTGAEACQTGQENVAYYTEQRADLGNGDAKNWWMLENDNTYGVVTRIHGNAATKFNWTCRGNDQPVAGNGSALPCTSQVMNNGATQLVPGVIDQWPAGSTADDGAVHAFRFKLEKLNMSTGSNRVCWSAQGYTYTGLPYDLTTKFGYKTQLGLVWDSATQAVYLTDRSNKICTVATQLTQGAALSDNGWVDVWCNAVRCPGTLNNAHYVYYSKNGGATWTESSPSPIVACRSDVPNSRIDIYAGNGSGKMIEYLLDYDCVGNKATPPGTIAIPAKPAAVVDASIGVVKSSPLGTPATFNGVITSTFSGKVPWDLMGTNVTIYYLEQPEPSGRENGVKVWISNGQSPTDINGNPYAPAIGDYVRVVGTLGKWNCEKMILACSMTQQAKENIANPGALGMVNKAVGASFSSTMATFIPPQVPAGSPGSPGANNHGLYAKVWGTVTYVGSNFFYVDDGSGLVDGVGDETTAVSTVKGIRVVDVNSFGLPALNAYVSISGSVGNTRVQFIDYTVPVVVDKVIPVIWMNGWQLELAAP